MNLLNKSKIATVFFGGFLCGAAYLVSCGQINVNSAGAGGSTTRYVKANGTSIGEFLSLNFDTQSSTNNFVSLTSTGYLLVIEQDGQVIDGQILYTSVDCSGTGYMNYMIANKSVFRNGTGLYYIGADASAVSGLTYQSTRPASTGVCEAYGGVGSNDLPVTANDPAVTGVSQNSFTPPITIE
jgi:hypothetical protein